MGVVSSTFPRGDEIVQKLPPIESDQVSVEVSEESRCWVPCTRMLDALDDTIHDTTADPQVKLKNICDIPLYIQSCLGIEAVFQESDPPAEGSLSPLAPQPCQPILSRNSED